METVSKYLSKIPFPVARWIFNVLLALGLYEFHKFTNELERVVSVQTELLQTVTKHDAEIKIMEKFVFNQNQK